MEGGDGLWAVTAGVGGVAVRLWEARFITMALFPSSIAPSRATRSPLAMRGRAGRLGRDLMLVYRALAARALPRTAQPYTIRRTRIPVLITAPFPTIQQPVVIALKAVLFPAVSAATAPTVAAASVAQFAISVKPR